ncbi:MAG: glycoside hydrolase family 3 C-terminal domain-containing protein [Candidatus Thorarchaeota archaeon]|nr:glycoside hydrolase family 3 C-terminal domain-containing protein [Candidatus Thorarchaeota archaeon]
MTIYNGYLLDYISGMSMATDNGQSIKYEIHNLDDQVDNLLSRLELKEKFQLLTSQGWTKMYSTNPIKRVGIPSFKMTDGPLGIARHSGGFKKATRFPATISLAATWDRNLAYEMGKAIAKEIRAIGRHMLLAPGINIHRTPLCGRTFEYFSEDPYLTKELAIPVVKGVQGEGIGACIKHYAANNQEIDRRSSSSELGERTLHEIYLKAFEEVVKEADPWSVMGSYNKINGVYGCENQYLLKDVLMDKWGFKGFVMTDWFATRPIETTEGCINAGLSLEMPIPNKYKRKSLQAALDAGKFSEDTLNDAVRRYLRVMFLTGAFAKPSELPSGAINTREHQELSRKIGEEGAVLLKNEGDLLPLKLEDVKTIALLGSNLKKKFGKIGYGGSSAVVPPYEITPFEGMKEKVSGKRIVSNPAEADVAIVFVGLNHDKGMDSETYDRKQLELPDDQVALIESTVEVNPNTIVVIVAGSPIAMDPWLDRVPAVLMPWYSGMEGGRVIANILFGDVSPSGKLPITFPRKLSDSPAHKESPRTYPGDEEKKVHYDEGIFVGYRWFDEKEVEPLFPFGYGLSYTSFDIGSVSFESDILSSPTDTLTVNVDITNTGSTAGSETIQIYSHDVESSVVRPRKELVGFEKAQVGVGESKTVSIKIKAKDLAFYDVDKQDWTIENGDFDLQIGTSSRDINHTARIRFD